MRLLQFLIILTAVAPVATLAQASEPGRTWIEVGVSTLAAKEYMREGGKNWTGYMQYAVGIPFRIGRAWTVQPELLYLDGVLGGQEVPRGTPGFATCRSSVCSFRPSDGLALGVQVRRYGFGVLRGGYAGVRGAFMSNQVTYDGGYVGVTAGTGLWTLGPLKLSLEGQLNGRIMDGFRPIVGLGLQAGL